MREKLSGVKKYLAFYVFLPIILDLIIESLNRKDFVSGVEYMLDKPFLFLFNVLIIMLTLCVAMFFRREIFVLSLISLVWLLFGIVNFVILHFRVTPFSAVDFTLISSAISVSGHYLTVLNIAMMVLAAAILVIAIVCLFKKAPCFHRNATKRAYIISSVIVLTLFGCIALIRNSSTSVQALADNYTNISEAYENYGFVYCFANSIIDTGISKPDGYSRESVLDLQESLGGGKDAPDVKPDIVMVQLESFFDIYDVKGLKFSQDPLPNFHRLQKEFSDGQLTVPTVGAGTVNTEFEVLTGMSQHDFGVSEYPYKTVLKNKPVQSICYNLAELGYTSHAVHNNTATFYGRNTVFSNLGFDTFTSVEYMNGITLNPNGWAKDDIMADEILETLDDGDGAHFTFGITVQSHGKYNDIEMDEKQPVQVSGAPKGKTASYQYYANQIYEVDQMVGELVQRLEKRNKPTMLVLYGDHLPSLDLVDEDLKSGNLYETQYIIWNNYGLETKDQDLTAYQLYSAVLQQADIHEGILTRYHQQSDWDSDDYLEGLHMLEYDMLYGENYIYDGQERFQSHDLRMGVKPVQITDVAREDGDIIVHGKNLTPYCSILFNGKTLEAEWVDEYHILLKEEPKLSDRKMEKRRNYNPEKIPNTFLLKVENGDGVDLSYGNALRWRNTSLSAADK